jgi:phosphatidylglycerophosphatase A
MPEMSATPFLTRVAVGVATGGGLGFLRPGPGTWGSLGAGAVAYALALMIPSSWWMLLMLGLVTACMGLAWLSMPRATTHFARKDPAQVVIDEVAGVWLAVALIPASVVAHEPFWSVILAVFFFRVFDIAKPWPINWLERIPGTFGIMADDAVAGIVAAGLAIACLH